MLLRAGAAKTPPCYKKLLENHGVKIQCAAGRKGGGNLPRNRKNVQKDEDVVLFDIDSGWNVEALAGAETLLDDLEGWEVESAPLAAGQPDNESGEVEEDEGMSDDEDFGMVWTVTEVEPAKGSSGGGSSSSFNGGSSGGKSSARSSNSSGARVPQSRRSAGAVGAAERDLLASLPEHVTRQLEALQADADEENAKTTPAALRKAAARQKTHRGGVKIIAGSAAGRRLLSPQGDQTRPMMELVRGAVFNMIMAMHGCTGGLPEGTRWLDLFAGTGAVGIEALSRGCSEAHFVELSTWVVSHCLLPNLATSEVENAAVVHTTKTEDFLRRAAAVPRFAGGAFDFISVCPPYELVSYPELFDLLEASALLHEESIVLVEYPKRLAEQIRPRLGPLTKVRDRQYGRTLVALYQAVEADEGYD